MTRIAQFIDFVGIDVSKSHLDVFTIPYGEVFRVSNDRRGLWELLSRLSCYDEALVVMEATGALEGEAALLLAESGFDVSVVNPRQVRDFSRAFSPKPMRWTLTPLPGLPKPSSQSRENPLIASTMSLKL